MAATKIDQEPPADGCYSTAQVAKMSGATYRQLDYWDRTGIITVAVPAHGSGSRRRWSDGNLAQARALALFSEGVYNDGERDVLSRLAQEVLAHPHEAVLLHLRGGLHLWYNPMAQDEGATDG